MIKIDNEFDAYEVTALVYNYGTLEVEDIGSDSVFDTLTNHGESWKEITVSFVSTGSLALIHTWYGPGSDNSYFDMVDVKDVTTEADLAKPIPHKNMRYPSQVFDISRWKITMPIDDAQEYFTPFLYTYSIDPWFTLAQNEDGYAITEFEYNEQPVNHTHVEEIDGCYFKVGTYTQSNDGTAPTESKEAYAETYVYDCKVTHE